MVFPCQVGSAFATSVCDSKRTAKKMMSDLTASASLLGMIVGPIAAASDAKLSGSRVVATDTSMPLRANALARARPILPKPTIAYLMNFSLGLARPTGSEYRMERPAGRSASELRKAAVNGDLAGGHEAAVRRREKRGHRSDLRRIGHALERIHRGEGLHAFLA